METNKELFTDAQIEQAALKHVAPLFGKIGAGGDYRLTEQFSRLKAFTAELFALSQRSEAACGLRPNIAGSFSSYQQWVNKGRSWLASPDHRRAICVDSLGRRVAIGADFMRARDEDAFPVYFFWDCEPNTSSPAPSAAAGEQVPAWDAYATARLRSIVDLLGLRTVVPDGAGYEFAVLGFVRREIERLKVAGSAQVSAKPVDELHEFQMYKSRKGHAAPYAGDGQFEYSTDQAEYEAWLARAALAAQPTPAQGDAVPVAANLSEAFGEKAADETVREFGQRMYNKGKVDAVPVATKCAACNGEGWVRDIHDMEQGRIRCTKCATRQSSADAVDAARYREIRKWSPRKFTDVWELNIAGKGAFDDLVDAIAAQGGKGGGDAV